MLITTDKVKFDFTINIGTMVLLLGLIVQAAYMMFTLKATAEAVEELKQKKVDVVVFGFEQERLKDVRDALDKFQVQLDNVRAELSRQGLRISP